MKRRKCIIILDFTMIWLILNGLYLIGSVGYQCTLFKLLSSQNSVHWCHDGLRIFFFFFFEVEAERNVSELKGKNPLSKINRRGFTKRERGLCLPGWWEMMLGDPSPCKKVNHVKSSCQWAVSKVMSVISGSNISLPWQDLPETSSHWYDDWWWRLNG